MKELKQLVRNVIAPEMGLGHSDSAVKSAVNTKDTSSASVATATSAAAAEQVVDTPASTLTAKAEDLSLSQSDQEARPEQECKTCLLHNTGRHSFDRAYEENDESVVIVEAVDNDVDGGGSFALVPDTKGTYIDRDRGIRTRQATDGVDDAEEEMGKERYGIRILG
ncbi:hypothetical protein BG006_009735 [Podila minutissima]|uniref:Uncharacterized protein n=1 Tax=Podila minutissima TaxID=64525 RepID=A0A9P5SE35_9FUNG|nr:hypothetical protein BG006_009735 [Podila minutissima]